MTTTWTIARVLDWTRQDFAARGLSAPRLDAELLLSFVLGLRRVDLYVRFDQPLSPEELTRVRALVERRRKHEPIAYITGRRDFYGRTFAVDPRVLIPRPETEQVVELALESLPSLGAEASVSPEPAPPTLTRRVLDVGTGSGILALTLAAERPDVTVDAVDLSPDALAVARANAESMGLSSRVRFHEGSLLEPVRGQRFHVIVSNPPYIERAELAGLMPDVRLHEPHTALDGGPSGLELITPLLREVGAMLEPDGLFVMEFGHLQGPAVLELARSSGLSHAAIKKDLSGRDRVLVARPPGADA
jgi:release factor glutamine methyltransferase